MNAIIARSNALAKWLDQATTDWLVPTLARFVFAATLLVYFWNSAVLKLGDGGISSLFSANANMFGQMYPKVAETVLWDVTQATAFQKLVMLSGTWAEFVLPLLVLLGLFTRLAAVGMIGFVIVQSLTDIFGHGADAKTIGSWFDNLSDGHILDQRAFWVFLFLVLVVKGGGPFSVDRFLFRERDEA